jgi:hypothetical protein
MAVCGIAVHMGGSGMDSDTLVMSRAEYDARMEEVATKAASKAVAEALAAVADGKQVRKPVSARANELWVYLDDKGVLRVVYMKEAVIDDEGQPALAWIRWHGREKEGVIRAERPYEEGTKYMLAVHDDGTPEPWFVKAVKKQAARNRKRPKMSRSGRKSKAVDQTGGPEQLVARSLVELDKKTA